MSLAQENTVPSIYAINGHLKTVKFLHERYLRSKMRDGMSLYSRLLRQRIKNKQRLEHYARIGLIPASKQDFAERLVHTFGDLAPMEVESIVRASMNGRAIRMPVHRAMFDSPNKVPFLPNTRKTMRRRCSRKNQF
jgi:hypothetical protein